MRKMTGNGSDLESVCFFENQTRLFGAFIQTLTVLRAVKMLRG